MSEIIRRCRLMILEPWEHGSESPVVVHIVKKWKNNYLLNLPDPVYLKGEKIAFLVGKLRDDSVNIVSADVHGTYILNLAYSPKMDISNFESNLLESFRGNFLLGEIYLE